VSHAAIAIENARLFERIRASEGKYRSLFEDSQDVVFISSPDGRFVDINPSGVRLFGYETREDLLHLDIRKDLFVSQSQYDNYRAALNRDGYVNNYELALRNKSGQRLTILETTTAVRNAAGEVVSYRGI